MYYIIAPSEASANLARYDGVKYGYSYQDGANMWENMEKTRQFGFGEEVKRRIMVGTYALSAGYYDAYYLKAQKIRTLIRREFDAAFATHDVLVAPVAPTPAFKIGEKVDDPLQMYLNDVCTIPVNIAGLPGMSVPCGFATAPDGATAPDRRAVHRQTVRRSDALPRRPRLRAVAGLAQAVPAVVVQSSAVMYRQTARRAPRQVDPPERPQQRTPTPTAIATRSEVLRDAEYFQSRRSCVSAPSDQD